MGLGQSKEKKKSMNTCKWCGRHFNSTNGVSDSFLGENVYCSQKCKEEDRAARKKGGGTRKSGCSVLLIVIIILIIASLCDDNNEDSNKLELESELKSELSESFDVINEENVTINQENSIMNNETNTINSDTIIEPNSMEENIYSETVDKIYVQDSINSEESM